MQTISFFGVVGLGYAAGRTGFFSPEATAYLTRFVFYFALSAMIFRFASRLDFAQIFHWPFVWAYLGASILVYGLATLIALMRRIGAAEAAVEAQCAVVGNVGFLGIPMLALLMGAKAVGYVMLILAMDLIVFGSLIVILITLSRNGRVAWGALGTVGRGLVANPMIVAMTLGLAWSWFALPIPGPVDQFLATLGAAATPGALFAIGASLAERSAERVAVAAWLSFAKLILHPAAITIAALVVFPVEPFAAAVMIASAAMPVAGNIYMLAQHYRVAPHRVSGAIFVSTVVSIVTLPLVIAWVSG